MSKYINMTEELARYVSEVITRENIVQKELRERTSLLPAHISRMMTPPDQVAFLALLSKIMDAELILEIGTFTGYATLAMALSLPKNSKIITLDVSREWTDIANEFWKKAGISNKIELKIGEAKETLQKLIEQKMSGKFDMIFIDANKSAYDFYYEKSLELLRSGGIIVLDNMLRGGAVIDELINDSGVSAIRQLNLKIRDDERVDASLLTIADGVTIVRKRN